MAGAFGSEKWHLFRSTGRSTCYLVYLRARSHLPKPLTEPGLWLDQNAAPTAFLEHPGLGALLRFSGADIEKKAIFSRLEKLPHQFTFRGRTYGLSNHAF